MAETDCRRGFHRPLVPILSAIAHHRSYHSGHWIDSPNPSVEGIGNEQRAIRASANPLGPAREASVAGIPSPLYAADPVPATVLMIPGCQIHRSHAIIALVGDIQHALPCTAKAAGSFSPASTADGPPSPPNRGWPTPATVVISALSWHPHDEPDDSWYRQCTDGLSIDRNRCRKIQQAPVRRTSVSAEPFGHAGPVHQITHGPAQVRLLGKGSCLPYASPSLKGSLSADAGSVRSAATSLSRWFIA